MSRLKILYLPLWYPSPGTNPFGGVFIRERVKAASLYNDVIVAYCYELSNERQVFYRISDELEDGIRTIRISLGYSNIKIISFIVRLIALSRILRRLIKSGWKPDIIDAHPYSAAVPAIIVKKFFKIPVVITEHSGIFELHRLSFIEKLMASFAMKRASIILPVSNDLKKSIQEFYGIKNRFQVVPNVVNTQIFKLHPNREIPAGDKKYLLSVSLLADHKGIGILLEALRPIMSTRQDFHLDIVGDGPQKEYYKKFVLSSGLGDFVSFHGWKKLDEVAEFMSKCDFFVLPSYHESFGTVYIEAMACGKPVIGSSSGGTSEIVNKDNGILVEPRNLQSLVNAIQYMLDNFSQYSSAKIATYAREKFSFEAVGKELDILYREVNVTK